MNIPENILQQVADEAFLSSNGGMMGLLTCNKEKNHVFWHEERYERRAVIKHALDNPALAPFLAGGIGVGEYTDEEILDSWRNTNLNHPQLASFGPKWIKAFLAALPRRESPALAEAIARAEKAEAERDFERSTADEAIARSDRTYAQICRAARSVGWINMAESGPITTFIRKIGGELAALKSTELGILRPIAEMPETVPDGCIMVFAYYDEDKEILFSDYAAGCDTAHFAILRLPATEARQERPVGFNSALETRGAAEPTPPAEPEPAAQVPLGPEDVSPGSVVRCDNDHWFQVLYASPVGVCINNVGLPVQYRWTELAERWQINTSLATGRWDANAWRPCSKPGKEVAK